MHRWPTTYQWHEHLLGTQPPDTHINRLHLLAVLAALPPVCRHSAHYIILTQSQAITTSYSAVELVTCGPSLLRSRLCAATLYSPSYMQHLVPHTKSSSRLSLPVVRPCCAPACVPPPCTVPRRCRAAPLPPPPCPGTHARGRGCCSSRPALRCHGCCTPGRMSAAVCSTVQQYRVGDMYGAARLLQLSTSAALS
jgi:hypothetical protein